MHKSIEIVERERERERGTLKENKKINNVGIACYAIQDHKGITLISLIVTILILLILVGVTLSITIGENGIFSQSKLAVEKYEQERQKEAQELDDVYNQMLGIISNRDDVGSSITAEQLQALIQQIESVKQKNEELTRNYNNITRRG